MFDEHVPCKFSEDQWDELRAELENLEPEEVVILGGSKAAIEKADRALELSIMADNFMMMMETKNLPACDKH